MFPRGNFMRTVSILVFVACFAVSIRAEVPKEVWRGQFLGIAGDGAVDVVALRP